MLDSIKNFISWLTECEEFDGPVNVPTEWAICDRCGGDGHHGNPAFDGTSTDWWLEGDPSGEDLDHYVSGRWDVHCDECGGSGKVRTMNEEQLSPELRQLWDKFCRIEGEIARDEAYERRWGY